MDKVIVGMMVVGILIFALGTILREGQIESRVAALEAQRPTKCAIYLAPGTYSINETIDMAEADCAIVGSGPETLVRVVEKN
jgi:hypothetical protein